MSFIKYDLTVTFKAKIKSLYLAYTSILAMRKVALPNLFILIIDL